MKVERQRVCAVAITYLIKHGHIATNVNE